MDMNKPNYRDTQSRRTHRECDYSKIFHSLTPLNCDATCIAFLPHHDWFRTDRLQRPGKLSFQKNPRQPKYRKYYADEYDEFILPAIDSSVAFEVIRPRTTFDFDVKDVAVIFTVLQIDLIGSGFD